MASDIPSGWSSSTEMARALASYIDCPHRIRAIVLENFLRSPSLETIRRYRAEHLAPRNEAEPFRFNEGYWPNDQRDRLDAANRRFLERLEIQRAVSTRARQERIAA